MKRDDWETPKKLFNYLDGRFDFNIDAAASKENKLCRKFYSQEKSLFNAGKEITKRTNSRIFCNPPYSMAKEFSEFCFLLYKLYQIPSYLLLPVRSDRVWYQQLLNSPHVRDEPYTGRIHFGGSGKGAFMYNIGVVIGFKEVKTEKYIDAGQFNDGGKGSAGT